MIYNDNKYSLIHENIFLIINGSVFVIIQGDVQLNYLFSLYKKI